ncbi:MAG: hypothetical protein GX330_05960 [Bacteroidales bacterium]|nr:hypothetical protein [Bacteroidales bacterium]
MKQIIALSLTLIIAISNLSCNPQNEQHPKKYTVVSNKIEVYYFHFSRRCKTCQLLEENTKLALEQLYGNEIKKEKYVFKSINLDKTENKSIAKELGVGGQALLVVSGSKKIDITNQGFMYAQDFEKIKKEIRIAIDKINK